MSHRFSIGQLVELRSAPRLSNRPAGVCTIMACLPHERGPVQYRIQSNHEQVQRVVEEDDLLPSTASPEPADAGAEPSPFSIAVNKRR